MKDILMYRVDNAESGVVVVWPPRWPGCRAQGTTLPEAVEVLRDIYPKFLRAMADMGVATFTDDPPTR